MNTPHIPGYAPFQMVSLLAIDCLLVHLMPLEPETPGRPICLANVSNPACPIQNTSPCMKTSNRCSL